MTGVRITRQRAEVLAMLSANGPVQPVGLHLDAGIAPDGSPRRLFVVLFESRHALAYDEGHRGERAVPADIRAYMKGWVAFRIPVSEYNKLRRASEDAG